jgi:hypothetical protein
MFGLDFHLGRSGTLIFTREWTSVVVQKCSLWCGVHICPLITLITSECPGSVTGGLCEFSVWLDSVYDNNMKVIRETWAGLAEALENVSAG